MYSQKYLAHFQDPKNLGSIDNPTAKTYVQYKGKGCFDRVNMFIKIENNVVEDIKYQVRGCSGTIAACSALTTLAKGKSTNDIKHVTKDDIVEELGGIPEQKQHSVDLAMEAFEELLSQIDQ